MQGDEGGNLSAEIDDAQILHDERVHVAQGGGADQLGHPGHLSIGDEGIEGQMDLHAADMAVFDRFAQLVICEIFGALTGIEVPETEIDRIRAVVHGGAQRLHRAGRG